MRKSANADNVQNLINTMLAGDKNAIAEGLNSDVAIARLNAVINVVRYKLHDEQIIELVRGLKSDDIVFDIYKISDFATAALQILGEEEYSGNRKQIVDLIESKFEF